MFIVEQHFEFIRYTSRSVGDGLKLLSKSEGKT